MRSPSKQTTRNGTTTLFSVTVPEGTGPNDTFYAMVKGQKYLVTNPNAKPGQTIKVPIKIANPKEPTLFAVTVPKGVKPNQKFQIKVSGRTLLVKCPPNAKGGQNIYVPVH